MSSVIDLHDLDFMSFVLKTRPWAEVKPIFLALYNMDPEFSETLVKLWTKAYALDFSMTSAKLLPGLDLFAAHSQENANSPMYFSLSHATKSSIFSTWSDQEADVSRALSLSVDFLFESSMEVRVKAEPSVIVSIEEGYRDTFSSPEFMATPKGSVVDISHRVDN